MGKEFEMASTKHLGRREFLRLSAMAAVGAVAASCAKPTPEVIEKPVTVVVEKEVAVEKQVLQTVVVEKQVPVEKVVKETVVVEKAVEVEKVVKETVIVEKEVVSSQLREAPMLAELVAAGKLPPVDERMPLKPKVCNEMPPSQLAFQVGRYGGTIRTLTSSANWDTDIFVMCNEPLINTPGILGEEITGNICDAFQVNAEQTEFTFHMREGIKWSDGTPVTTEDVRFAYEDVMMNTDLTARPPTWLRSGNKGTGTPYVVKVKDDYTFTISFDKPYGGFLLVLGISGWRSYIEVLKPAHYLKKFHTKYASKAEIDAAIKEANVEGWPQLFALKDVTNWEMTYPPALTFPSLYPWILKETSQQGQIYERNPYYFKVDPAGNQLPYVDYLDSGYVADTEVIQMKILAGETDFSRSHPKFVKLPLYKENEEKGGFTTAMVQFHATSIDLFLNLTHVDPVWRQVVRNPDFRRALNLALDREEIIDAVLYGYASLPDFNPAEYNVEKANQLLDSIGLNKKNADGYRLGPDGQVFEIPLRDRRAAHGHDPHPRAGGPVLGEGGHPHHDEDHRWRVVDPAQRGQRAQSHHLLGGGAVVQLAGRHQPVGAAVGPVVEHGRRRGRGAAAGREGPAGRARHHHHPAARGGHQGLRRDEKAGRRPDLLLCARGEGAAASDL